MSYATSWVKHTAGPWTLEGAATDTVFICSHVNPFESYLVAKLRAYRARDDYGNGLGPTATQVAEVAANARLIAAAPELFAALRELVDAMLSAVDPDRPNRLEHRITAARAALRNAEVA